MKKINLLIDAHVFDGEFQGSRTYIENIYKEAIKGFSDNFNFYFAANDIENLKQTYGESPAINYLKLNDSNKFYRLGIEFPRLIKTHKIDWAHFQYVIPPIKSCKYLVTTHDILFERLPKFFPWHYKLSKHFLFKYGAKNADLLTSVSDFSKEEISNFYGIGLDKIHVIPNGVKLDESAKKLDKEKMILYLSRIEPRKNHDLLLEAFLDSGLIEKGFQLYIIGKESIPNLRFNELLKSANEKTRGSIHIINSVSENEKIELFFKSELFVYPSLAEGFGIPPLEAAIYKTKVLCSNQTAMKEFDFFKPHHINPDSSEIIKSAILNALSDKTIDLDKISDKVIQNYSWKKSADKLCQLIIETD